MKSVGLIDAHAYSLIKAQEIVTDSGKTVKLVKIRNPWGKKEWTGDWSDKSPLWTEKCKAQVDYANADDGCFWMTFEDYDKFFYITTINYFRDDFIRTAVCDEHEIGGFGIIKVIVTTE